MTNGDDLLIKTKRGKILTIDELDKEHREKIQNDSESANQDIDPEEIESDEEEIGDGSDRDSRSAARRRKRRRDRRSRRLSPKGRV